MRAGSSGLPWKGVDPSQTGSHWAIPNRELPNEIRNKSSQKKLEYLDRIGRIYWPPKGSVPAYKRYLDEMPGTAIDTLWDDIGNLQAQSKERVGYPTQKPLKLLGRIIKASSNEGDMILDPFAGCATACVSAERLGRQWVGIDISEKAADLVQVRIRKEIDCFTTSSRFADPTFQDGRTLANCPATGHTNTSYSASKRVCAEVARCSFHSAILRWIISFLRVRVGVTTWTTFNSCAGRAIP